MERIGVRELRQNASVWLRRVEAGESFEITNHGRVIARLVPEPAGSGLDGLIADGSVSRPRLQFFELGPPLEPTPGLPTASEILEQMRADERF